MKKFIAGNWFKIIIAVAVLIVAISAGYYFLVYLPKIQLSQELSKNIENCSQLEQKVYKNYVDLIYHGTITGGDSVSSENHYNQELNKCFVEIVNISPAPHNFQMTTTNIYDGEEDMVIAQSVVSFNNGITSGTYWSQDKAFGMSLVDFENLEIKYMGTIN